MTSLNKLAVEITEEEGGAVNINIAQVKEVMRLVFTKLASMSLKEIGTILEKYQA